MTTLGARADPVRDRVVVDGQTVRPPRRLRTVLLHKPRGVVTTLKDTQGRPSVAALVADAGMRLFPVGRLDLQTTGLLLLTNDGALAAGLAHPRRAVARVYRAKVDGTPSPATLRRLRTGVRLDDGPASLASVRLATRLPTKTWLVCTVHEGRWRLVRRLLAAVGHPVDKLERIRFGPVGLGILPPGAWRDATPAEVEALREAAGLSDAPGADAAAAPRKPRKPARTPPPRPRSRPRGAPRGAPPDARVAGSSVRPRPRRGRPRS